MTERRLEYIDIDELRPDPRNPKEHADAALGASLDRFGFTESVMLDERTGMLVAGHGRREMVLAHRAAGKPPPDGIVVDDSGRWLVPVIRGWSSSDDTEAGAYLVASNQLTMKGGWHDDHLAAILTELATNPMPTLTDDPFGGLGFDSDEITALITGTPTPPPRTPAAYTPTPPAPRAEPVTVEILAGDSLELLAAMADDSIDAVVTDPPYGLEFMGKDWDTFRIDDRSARWAGSESGGAGAGLTGDDERDVPFAGRPAFGKRRTTSTCRTCGKRDAFRNPHPCDEAGTAEWATIPVDVVPIEMRAFQNWCSLWAAELYRVLKPGGHVLAFGGTRTYHRLASGIEDAGFDVRDSLHWLQGQGFPKSLNMQIAGGDRVCQCAGGGSPAPEHALPRLRCSGCTDARRS